MLIFFFLFYKLDQIKKIDIRQELLSVLYLEK